MVTMHKRKTHKKSKAAQIRKLTNQGSLTPAEIATKLGVAVNYVYVVRGQMKQDGLVRTLPPVDPIAMPFQTYQEPFNKLRADRIRTNAAENVWLRRFDLGLNKDENNTDTANSRATT
jgi:hypothetical protein